MEPKGAGRFRHGSTIAPTIERDQYRLPCHNPLFWGDLQRQNLPNSRASSGVVRGDLHTKASTAAAASLYVGEQLRQAHSNLLFRTWLPGTQVHLGNSGPISFATNVGESGSEVA